MIGQDIIVYFGHLHTQKKFNGTRNLTYQDIQTPSHSIHDETVETIP